MINQEEELSAQTAPIKVVVIPGGGSKGVTLIGALRALEKKGIMEDVETLAGSSAGAIMTVLASSGLSADEIDKRLSARPFKELLGSGGIDRPGQFFKKGEPFEEFVNKSIAGGIRDYLEHSDISKIAAARFEQLENKLVAIENEKARKIQKLLEQSDLNKKAELTNEIQRLKWDQENISTQQNKISQIISSDGKVIEEIYNKTDPNEKNKAHINFGDLSYLHALEPKKFKNPYITTVDKKTGELRVWGEHSPDVSIAKATHASAAIPFVFRSVNVNDEQQVDGGYKKNIPIDIMNHRYNDKGQKIISKSSDLLADITNDSRAISKGVKERPLVLVYGDYDNSADDRTHAINTMKPFKDGNAVLKIAEKAGLKIIGVSTSFTRHDAMTETSEELRKDSANTVLLPINRLGTTEFDKADKDKEYYVAGGQLATERHL